jgi:hypothetical protein
MLKNFNEGEEESQKEEDEVAKEDIFAEHKSQ